MTTPSRPTTALRVECSACGFLGVFFVRPDQPIEGVQVRAENLRGKHACSGGKVKVVEEEEGHA